MGLRVGDMVVLCNTRLAGERGMITQIEPLESGGAFFYRIRLTRPPRILVSAYPYQVQASSPPLPLDFNFVVSWDAMPWRPDLKNLPTIISRELNRRRALRRK